MVGGGPAGLKAAEVAARRGHRVTLVERRLQLGGRLRLATEVKGRGEIAGIFTHLEGQLQRLDVEVRLDEGSAETRCSTSTRPE